MSKVISLRTYRIAVIVCTVCGGLFGYWLSSDISKSKVKDAYERGYKDASWFVKYDIEANPTVPAIGSVDTVPLEPLYVRIVLDTTDDCCAPGIVSFDNFRVSSLNIDRIDTVKTSPIASLGHDWYAQNDSTLCRQFGGGYGGFAFPHSWCYLIQVHLKQGSE